MCRTHDIQAQNRERKGGSVKSYTRENSEEYLGSEDGKEAVAALKGGHPSSPEMSFHQPS